MPFCLMNIGAEPTGAGCTKAKTSGGIVLVLAVPAWPQPSHPIPQVLGIWLEREHHTALVYRKGRARVSFAAQWLVDRADSQMLVDAQTLL